MGDPFGNILSVVQLVVQILNTLKNYISTIPLTRLIH